jgi:hypothetical protein
MPAADRRDWLDEIEAQIDSTVPFYVPRLIATIRAQRAQLLEMRLKANQLGDLVDRILRNLRGETD